MFFPEKIVSIKSTDRVLEVGPGGTPFHRSDVLLEKKFSPEEANEQRGHAKELITDKRVVFYDGGTFPFKDKEFDYVICSHVLEHIPCDQIEYFVSELQRVAKKGYLEFPTIYYDYIYNFPKHLTFLLYKNGVISYLGKEETEINLFLPVQQFFYHSADAGHTSLTRSLKQYFFQGFEWEDEINIRKVTHINEVVYDNEIFNRIINVQDKGISCKQKLKNKVKYLFRSYRNFFNLYILRDRFLLAHKKWILDQGDNTLRLEYDLTPESIVFDLGGYQGDFADAIYKRYRCNIYIFEPVSSFYEGICQKFCDNPKIKVFNFGLSNKEETIEINLSGDGSSVFKDTNVKDIIELRDIVLFLEKQNIPKIDLMKINIEGGEFLVLPELIKSSFILKISNLQVQFHEFIDGSEEKRNEIREFLKKTHYLTYDYWFVWENWKKY